MGHAGKSCAVIGAGIVGSCCAWHLQRRGIEVTLVDPVLPGQSCSFGNAACLSASSVIPYSYPGVIRKLPGWLFDPLGPMTIRWRDFPALVPWFWKFWRSGNMRRVEAAASAQTQLMRSVFADYDAILGSIGAAQLKRASGAIQFYDTEKEYQRDQWQHDLCARHGFSKRRLTTAELKDRAPALKLDGGIALAVPDWHYLLDPGKVTQCIAEASFAEGAAWLQDRVTSVRSTDSGVSLATESGRQLRADTLVVAAGAWSNKLARQLDYAVPMIAKRGYHSQIAEPGVALDCPLMSMSRMFVMTPLADGLRVAGTAEFAALDAEPDYRRADALLEHARHYLDGLQTAGATQWMGQRPMMADSVPVLSPSPRHRNVFYAFGHGHYGLTQGPTSGRIVADMVCARKPALDLTPYRFERFQRP
jgi:D-amino-acid dehydrogenase